MRRIAAAFQAAAGEGRAAFVAYLTAGDPSPDRTPELVAALETAGADVVELGVPFSDPLADGPVNQRAAERALSQGTSLARVLEIAARIRRTSQVPLVLFTYYNPVHRMGLEAFSGRAADAGVDGVLVTDLSVEDAGPYLRAARGAGLDTVFLAAPTSGRARVEAVARESRGFLYYISRTGVTGDPSDLSASLGGEVKAVRECTDLPVGVGFGISSPEQVRRTAALADGVVVGSALVARIEEHGSSPDLPERLADFARSLAAATRRTDR